MIKAIIFDFDDTLIKTKEMSFDKHATIGRQFGYVLERHAFKEHYGKPWPIMIQHIFPGLPFSVFYAALVSKEKDYPFEAFEGVSSFLHFLREQGVLLGILTSDFRDSFLQRARRLGFLQYFEKDLIICADDTPYHKPDGRAFLKIIEYLQHRNLRPEEGIFVGDHFVDYEAAKAAGIPFFAVTTGFKTAIDFIEAGLSPLHILSSVVDLKQKLIQSEVFS